MDEDYYSIVSFLVIVVMSAHYQFMCQAHQHFLLYDMDFLKSNGLVDKLSCHLLTTMIFWINK